MPAPKKPLRTRASAVDYLRENWGINRSTATLAKLASVGGGPKFRKAGRTPLYSEPDLDAWAASLLSEPSNGGRAA